MDRLNAGFEVVNIQSGGIACSCTCIDAWEVIGLYRNIDVWIVVGLCLE
jgi:hypothetical protein